MLGNQVVSRSRGGLSIPVCRSVTIEFLSDGLAQQVPVAAPFLAPFAAGVLDEDAAHGLGCCREEMAATVPALSLVLAHQPQVCLVDQGGADFGHPTTECRSLAVGTQLPTDRSFFWLIGEMRVLPLPGHRDIYRLATRSWLGNGNGFQRPNL